MHLYKLEVLIIPTTWYWEAPLLTFMYADTSKPPAPLPTAQVLKLRDGVSLLSPLSRRGHGPGLVILTGASQDPSAFHEGVPSSLVKWAEEGYTVVLLEPAAFGESSSDETLTEAAAALAQCEKCEPKGPIGLVGMLICTCGLPL